MRKVRNLVDVDHKSFKEIKRNKKLDVYAEKPEFYKKNGYVYIRCDKKIIKRKVKKVDGDYIFLKKQSSNFIIILMFLVVLFGLYFYFKGGKL